jgi:hypothetical protein
MDTFNNTLGPKLTAHMSCAVKLVAKILIDAEAHRDVASTTSMASTAAALDASVERVMGQFAQPLFTHSIHAFRGGREMPESLFADMFLSNYFDGYLLEGYEATCTLLAATGVSGGAVPSFFTHAFYDGVMGMLLTNCQSVLLEQGGQGRRDGVGEGEGEGEGPLMQVKGTALYALYSKANHACVGDWTNRPLVCREVASREVEGEGEGDGEGEGNVYERVGVNIYAGRDIACGDEVMNCYFAEGSGMGLSKSQRREKLLQYRFLCECRMCLDEASSDSDSDSDSDSEHPPQDIGE